MLELWRLADFLVWLQQSCALYLDTVLHFPLNSIMVQGTPFFDTLALEVR